MAELLGENFAGDVLVNGEPADLTYQVKTGDVIVAAQSGSQPIVEQFDDEVAAPEPQPVEAPVLGAPLAVNLNGRQVSLPAKPSGEPHYLVDALQHSGLDFDNLHQPVELLVNGQPGQFSQTLRKDDEVIIRYQDAERE